ncbi:MAG: hypothetical protein LUG16_08750, partial [Candidatus Gastranaerophilales bacterium]|nr:hypothetical protein [Candidatus Gastranaerophilales bacterium]
LKNKEFLPETAGFCSKIISFDEFLKLNNFKINNCSNNYVYHKPLLRQNECYLPNIKTINRKGACSLTENFFILKHRAISELLLKNTSYKKEEIAEKDIITTCQLSKWGLIKASKANKINCKVLSYPEFINNVKD